MDISHLTLKPYKVRSIGGALVVTLPSHILRIVPLKAGDSVFFNTDGQVIKMKAAPKAKGKSK